MCLNCECQDFDCDKANIEEIVGVLLFERVDELKIEEAEQVKDIYYHIDFCDDCKPKYDNFIGDMLYDDPNPDMVVFKNYSRNLLILRGPYIHPPVIIDDDVFIDNNALQR